MPMKKLEPAEQREPRANDSFEYSEDQEQAKASGSIVRRRALLFE